MKSLNCRKFENKTARRRWSLGTDAREDVMGQLHPISSGAKILVVEDEALIGEMIADALQEQGFDVFLVSNAPMPCGMWSPARRSTRCSPM
jgi:PleD family two-component response regulator